MLKRFVTIVFSLFLFISFSGLLFAQKESEKKQNTVQCMHCKKIVDKSDIVSVPQYFLRMPDIDDPIRFLQICSKCDQLPKCRYCQMPTENKMDSDGIYLCSFCQGLKPRYLDRTTAEKMTDEVRNYLASKFKMTIKQKITVKVESSGEINEKIDSYAYYSSDGSIHYPDDLAKSGLFFYPEAAHELTHAWYVENGFKLVGGGRDPYSEGFAQFVTWCYLESRKVNLPKDYTGDLLEILLDSEMKLIEGKKDKAYGDGFRMIRAMMEKARNAQEWKKILQQELKKGTPLKGTCIYCRKEATLQIAGGDFLCNDCFKNSIKNDSEAEKAMKDIRRVLDTKFKMTATRHVISYKIGSSKELDLETGRENIEPGRFEVKTVRNKNPQYTIRILVGLPREEFRATGAHELAHDWMNEKLPHLVNIPEIYEGFAEYVAWSLAKAEGSKHMVETIENRTDKVYGAGFRKVREMMGDAKTADKWEKILLKEYPAPNTKDSGKASSNPSRANNSGR